jgi:hydroxymethylpyrimidine/phosphomethylpyrimidine kinase
MTTLTPIAVTIAGSDSSGGAGIQADIKTFSALGVYGATVITALTAQNTLGVTAIHGVPADFVRAQFDAVYSDLAVAATKIGMLSEPAVIEAVAAGLDTVPDCPVVLDPVMVAASGDPLIGDESVAVLKDLLLPRATIVTPNLAEAARLTGQPEATTEDEMAEQAAILMEAGARAVLLKGGHGTTDESVDLLATRDTEMRLPAPRIDTRNTHGTGCTLSAAIAAGLARGLTLTDAVSAAKIYITGAIVASDKLTIGAGHGPVHHFHEFWRTA